MATITDYLDGVFSRKAMTLDRHTHDCEDCRYLGTAILRLKLWDFYFCPKGAGTILARYGGNRWEYSSVPVTIALDLAESSSPMASVFKYGVEKYIAG